MTAIGIRQSAQILGRSVKNAVAGVNNLISRAGNGSLIPERMVYMVTDRCNSRCIHCNIWKKEPVKDPLTPEELEQVLSDDLFKNIKYVLCTGGEPAVREDLKDLIFAINKVLPRATIQLSTNGLLPDKVIQIVKSGIEHGISFDVGVSLDGIGEAHDKIRGITGNFNKTDRLLNELSELKKNNKNKLHIAAGIVVSDLTIDTLPKVREYAGNLNIDLTEAWYNEASFYDNVGKNTFNSRLVKAVTSQLPSPVRELWLKSLKGKPIKFPCFAMYNFFVLKSNGDMVPCLNQWEINAGNVRESSPSDIWQGINAKKARYHVKSCTGCLNSWGAGWSLEAAYYPLLLFYLRHPGIVMEKLRNR